MTGNHFQRCNVIRVIRATVFAAVIAGAVSSAALAEVINIDFGTNVTATSTSVPVATLNSFNQQYVGLGAAPDTGTVWNSLKLDASVPQVFGDAGGGVPLAYLANFTGASFSSLVDSAGASTGRSVTIANDGSARMILYHNNLASTPLLPSGSFDLWREQLNQHDNNTGTVTLGGYNPGDLVDLYLYSGGDVGGRKANFTVNGVSTQLADSNIPRNNFVLGVDYARFTTTADAGGEIAITWSRGTSPEGAFNGMQVVFQAAAVAGDTDGDLDVDMVDYENIRANFRSTGATRLQGDLTNAGGGYGDGVVDFYDFIQWQENFPTPAGGGSLTGAVPEPNTILLVSIAGGLAVCRRGVKS